MSEEFTDYSLPETAYTTFDAQSLKSLIIDRLNKQGSFTDQIYEGSNLSSFIDVIAYSYHVLMFYLNRTSSESVFTEATIYENVNKIVKILNYNPLGFQTSTLPFKIYASSDLVPGTYTIPRYTYINSNGVGYTTVKDISFTKITTGEEELSSISDYHLLYQGTWVEAAPMTAIGNSFELFLLTSDEENTHIDHFNIHVYVKHIDDGKYYEYKETDSIHLTGESSMVFEKRLNHDMSYEIKFGNQINGRKLIPGDIVQIYYLRSVGASGRVGPNFLDKNKLVMMGTNTFNTVKEDIRSENLNFITYDNLETLAMTNDTSSTFPQDRENVDDIKRKAPIHHITQDRLVTINDYNIYMSKNFNRILSDVKVIDNKQYLKTHVKYLSEVIGIDNPFTESRVMFNHLEFGSSYTSNNVYIYAVPKILNTTSLMPMTTYLTPSQRNLINNSIEDITMIGHQPIIVDPVYMAVDIGLRASGEEELPDLVTNCKLQIERSAGVSKDDSAILEEVATTITKYFDNTSVGLGFKIDLLSLGQKLLDIIGVENVYTTRNDTGQKTQGISICVWNPVYETQDVTITTQNLKLDIFKFPYLHDVTNLINKLEII